jgi:hypothetical protein
MFSPLSKNLRINSSFVSQVASCKCEAWPLTLTLHFELRDREYQKGAENDVEHLHTVNSSLNTIRTMKYKWMVWTRYETCRI